MSISGESNKKKQKLEHLEHENISVNSNELIELVFLTETAKSTVARYPVKPDYSHQLFDNETVSIDHYPCEKLTLSISCWNLSFSLQFPSTFSTEQIQTFTEKMTAALPSGYRIPEHDGASKLIENNISPPGSQLKTFELEDSKFQIRLATAKDKNTCNLVSKCEKLALWFIETADSVDFTDERWEILLLFQQGSSTNVQNLAGYLTLFTFHNPIHGARLRVCQALILPQYQGKGLGGRLLTTVYELAASREHTVQVTVEDPAPAFCSLRDSVDLRWLVTNYTKEEMSKMEVEEALVEELSSRLKLIPAQVEFLLQAIQYWSLKKLENRVKGVDENLANREVGSTGGAIDEEEVSSIGVVAKRWKQFRLLVKRRLLKGDKELKYLDRSEMQRELQQLYDKEILRFDRVSRSAKSLGL